MPGIPARRQRAGSEKAARRPRTAVGPTNRRKRAGTQARTRTQEATRRARRTTWHRRRAHPILWPTSARLCAPSCPRRLLPAVDRLPPAAGPSQLSESLSESPHARLSPRIEAGIIRVARRCSTARRAAQRLGARPGARRTRGRSRLLRGPERPRRRRLLLVCGTRRHRPLCPTAAMSHNSPQYAAICRNKPQ